MTVQLGDMWTIIIGTVGLALTVINIIDKAQSFHEKAKQPDVEQDKRIGALENSVEKINMKLAEHEGYFLNDQTRLNNLENSIKESNRVIVKSLQALTEHALDGNNMDQLKKSKEELHEYLLNR